MGRQVGQQVGRQVDEVCSFVNVSHRLQFGVVDARHRQALAGLRHDLCGAPGHAAEQGVQPARRCRAQAHKCITTIVCGHTLGEYCFIAAGAVVTAPVPAYALMAGVPARRIGWMSRAGGRLGGDLVCPIDGTRYREYDHGAGIEPLSS